MRLINLEEEGWTDGLVTRAFPAISPASVCSGGAISPGRDTVHHWGPGGLGHLSQEPGSGRWLSWRARSRFTATAVGQCPDWTLLVGFFFFFGLGQTRALLSLTIGCGGGHIWPLQLIWKKKTKNWGPWPLGACGGLGTLCLYGHACTFMSECRCVC